MLKAILCIYHYIDIYTPRTPGLKPRFPGVVRDVHPFSVLRCGFCFDCLRSVYYTQC